MNTNRPEDRWTSFNDTMLPRFYPLAGTISWDEGPLGARASRPHNAWHSLAHLRHLDRLATAPQLFFALAIGVPAGVVAACKLALTLSGLYEGKWMRARRPRSQGDLSSLMRRGGAGSAPGNRYFFNFPCKSRGGDTPHRLARGLR